MMLNIDVVSVFQKAIKMTSVQVIQAVVLKDKKEDGFQVVIVHDVDENLVNDNEILEH